MFPPSDVDLEDEDDSQETRKRGKKGQKSKYSYEDEDYKTSTRNRGRSPGDVGSPKGVFSKIWTSVEKALYCKELRKHGKDFIKIQEVIPEKTVA